MNFTSFKKMSPKLIFCIFLFSFLLLQCQACKFYLILTIISLFFFNFFFHCVFIKIVEQNLCECPSTYYCVILDNGKGFKCIAKGPFVKNLNLGIDSGKRSYNIDATNNFTRELSKKRKFWLRKNYKNQNFWWKLDKL